MFFWSSLGKGCNIAHAVGLFGGYPSSASPGISIANTDLREKLARGDDDMPTGAVELAVERTISGTYTFEHENRTARVGTDGDVLVQMDSGGAGYGDVLKRDPHLVVKDVRRDVISRWTAENIYQVRFTRSGRLDEAGTQEARAGARRERIRLGRTWDEFDAEWSELRPDPAALTYFGSWPDGTPETPIIRI
jgi:N-methylhydantoinase B/oxoprolinase/acetone carboxylase alpha subunit